jgi:hypothetical protein
LLKIASLATVAALAAAPLLADFTYQETSTITGGAMMSMLKVVGVFSKQAREPIVATVSVKGDRMLHKTNTHATVMDLSTQTITTIDFQKKQYSVMTFEEMKQALEQMSQKMKEKQKDGAEMKFKVSANATGKTKQAAGFDAKEMILKMEMEGTDQKSGQKGGMTMTSDMWIAQGVPGYQEVRDFYRRMSEKLNWTPGGNMFMANPDVSKGMAEVYKEVAKLDGVPVEQYISMGVAGQEPPADGSAPPPQQQRQAEPQQSAPPTSVGSAIGGALGGRFGLGKKKKDADPPPAQSAGNTNSAPASAGGSLLEMKTVSSGFNTGSVDSSLFEAPAGFKKVESDLKKMR